MDTMNFSRIELLDDSNYGIWSMKVEAPLDAIDLFEDVIENDKPLKNGAVIQEQIDSTVSTEINDDQTTDDEEDGNKNVSNRPVRERRLPSRYVDYEKYSVSDATPETAVSRDKDQTESQYRCKLEHYSRCKILQWIFSQPWRECCWMEEQYTETCGIVNDGCVCAVKWCVSMLEQLNENHLLDAPIPIETYSQGLIDWINNPKVSCGT
ncbi:hypothetical protein AVEN_93038-1 [Araneus ventricosus]|uniref:Uncharacterized protein n=1 Tax=Araneus ventricosus TaxID=182803 RepID=A0A4Y2NCQ8_ARAVE|nr:hypothetical protein AVEN_93038-1 [Araneus ventricosus]